MKVQQFDGGLNTRLEPQLLGVNQGVAYDNIDNSSAVLRSELDKVATAEEVQRYAKYFRKEDTWLSSTTPTDFLEFQSSMLIANRTGRPQKYRNGEYNFLGIIGPTAAPGLVNVNSVKTIDEVTVKNRTDTGNLPGGNLHYMVVNSNNDFYSLPYQITVDASGTTTTTASGTFDTAWTIGIPAPATDVSTVEKPTNRAVKFSSLKGRSGDTAYVYRWYEGDWYRVGELASASATFTDATEDISGNLVLDPDKITAFFGVYSYIYTFYNSDDGTESKPSSVSTELEGVDGGFIRITGIQTSSDPQVDKVRIYRVGNNIGSFTLVDEVDNGVSTYDDELRDTAVDGRLLESDNFYEAPSGLKYLAESYAMIFGAIDSTLRFTPIGKPNAWPIEYSIEFDSDITGIGPVANGVLVFTEDRTHIVTGTGPLLLAQQPLRGDQGCISHDSIQQVEAGSLIWASKDGLCTSSGNNVISLTKQYLDEEVLDPVDSEVLNEVYYCLNSDGSILSWDYRFTPLVKRLNLGIQSIAKKRAELYGWNNGVFYKLFQEGDLEFSYKSPRFIEGSFTETKTYKKVYIRSEGDIIINIIIDDEQVATRSLNGKETHVIQVPQDKQRGYSIQFEMTGVGVVHELEYTVGRRQSG